MGEKYNRLRPEFAGLEAKNSDFAFDYEAQCSIDWSSVPLAACSAGGTGIFAQVARSTYSSHAIVALSIFVAVQSATETLAKPASNPVSRILR